LARFRPRNRTPREGKNLTDLRLSAKEGEKWVRVTGTTKKRAVVKLDRGTKVKNSSYP